MKATKIVWCMTAFAVLLALPASAADKDKGAATVRADKNMFREGGRGSLTITNQASFDIIIFAGKVSNNNVLGGIRAGKSRAFDLSALSLPAKNGSFIVRAASFAAYNKKTTALPRPTSCIRGWWCTI